MVSHRFVEENRAEILRIARANGATRVRVFGSVARCLARPDSDLDLLVEFEPGRSLLDLVAIKQDLGDLLGREVHVVTEAAVSPYMREEILQDATPL
jgi:predicted nucleotidyltransferase